MDIDNFNFAPLTNAQAADILSWRYAPPLDFYNPPSNTPGMVENLVDPQWQFHGIVYDQRLVGYASFGADGQLPGGNYSKPALDIGLGMHPDLVGQGYGAAFVSAIASFAISHFIPQSLRITVAAFNQRALALYQGLQFEHTATFSHQQTQYLVLVKRLKTQSGH